MRYAEDWSKRGTPTDWPCHLYTSKNPFDARKIQREKYCSSFKRCSRIISFPFLFCWVWELSLNSEGKSHLLLSMSLLVVRDPRWTWFLYQSPGIGSLLLLNRLTQNCLMLATFITRTANTYYICIDSMNKWDDEIRSASYSKQSHTGLLTFYDQHCWCGEKEKIN